MTKEQLKARIAKVLGVSASEKELAFDVMKKSLSESLEYNQAIRIENIGIFQLKKEPLPREERKETEKGKAPVKDTLLFTPLPEDISKDSENLFLSFDVSVPKKSSNEFDESVFSIGVGKPIVPIGSLGEEGDKATSYSALRKSLEQKTVKEIENSNRMDEFDIWDDYLSNLTAHLKEEKDGETLTEADEELDSVTEEDTPEEEQSGEYDADEINKLFEQQSETEEEPEQEEAAEEVTEPEPVVDEPEDTTEEVHDDDFLEDVNLTDNFERLMEPLDDDIPEEEDITEEELEQQLEDFEPGEEMEDETEEEELVGFDNDETIDSFSKFHEEVGAADDDAVEEEDEIKAEDEEPELPEGFEEMVGDEDEPKEDDVDWNWGSELQDELGEGEGEEAPPEDGDAFEQLEKTLTGEIEGEETEEEPEEGEGGEEETPEEEDEELKNEFSAQPQEDIEDDDDDDLTDTDDDEEKEKPKLGFKSLRARRQSLGKMFWVILAAFVVVTVAGVYLIFGGGEDEPDAATTDTENHQTTGQNTGDDINVTGLEDGEGAANEGAHSGNNGASQAEQRENTPVESRETVRNSNTSTSTPRQDGTLYRKVPGEERITSQIYSDGSRYMVQVSSWKRSETAESEVRRLKEKGYDAFIVEAYLPNLGGTWYRVRIGYFDTRGDAQQFLNRENY